LGPRLFTNIAYSNAVEEAGGTAILIARPTEEAELDLLIEMTDGLLLIGGIDVEPRHYEKNSCKHVQPPDPERDTLELSLLERAEKKKIPVFGICRGFQVLNTYAGGTLFRDIEDERPGSLRHDRHDISDRSFLAHEVQVVKESVFASFVHKEKFSVNSLHHQGIDRIGSGLRAAAHSSDGLIEAIEQPDSLFWIGTQWHPEELWDEQSRSLFHAFIQTCAHNLQKSVMHVIPNRISTT
jgi:putative glutamine amidotransferase